MLNQERDIAHKVPAGGAAGINQYGTAAIKDATPTPAFLQLLLGLSIFVDLIHPFNQESQSRRVGFFRVSVATERNAGWLA